MSKLVFRRATEEDLTAIIELLFDDVLGKTREASSRTVGPGYRDAFTAIDGDPHQLLAVAVDGTEVVGTLQLSFIPGLARQGAWRGQIEAVRVSSARRGRGIGKEMMEWAISQCRLHGCSHVQLTSDKRRADAHRFYEALGFAPSHVGYKLAV